MDHSKYSNLIREGLMSQRGAENQKTHEECNSRLGLTNGSTNSNYIIDLTLEQVFSDANVEKAVTKVYKNKGAAGIDGMTVFEHPDYMNKNWTDIKGQILDGKYRPNAVKRVEIPKENGKKRPLGISTVVDRVIMQTINLALELHYEPFFSDNGFGFRKGKNAHQAIARCQQYINEGYQYVVDLDLEKFFDTVNQDKLISKLALRIKDGRILSLIHRFMKSDIFSHGMFIETDKGLVQGSPLSPLLSGIVLDDLYRLLESRGYRHVRYCDDLICFMKTPKGAQRVLKSITKFVENKLKLKVNKEKTVVALASKIKYLGFGFYFKGGKALVRIHEKSKNCIKQKLRNVLKKTAGHISNNDLIVTLRRIITGWVNYYKIANMKGFLKELDAWMRSKIRCKFWKQWKKVRTRFKNLRALGLSEADAIKFANAR